MADLQIKPLANGFKVARLGFPFVEGLKSELDLLLCVGVQLTDAGRNHGAYFDDLIPTEAWTTINHWPTGAVNDAN